MCSSKKVETLDERASYGMIDADDVNYQKLNFGMHHVGQRQEQCDIIMSDLPALIVFFFFKEFTFRSQVC